MNLYIDYSEFELTCWNTDGKGTNVAIPLTLSDYCSDRDGGRYDAEVANGRGYYDASGKFHYHHVPNDEW